MRFWKDEERNMRHKIFAYIRSLLHQIFISAYATDETISNMIII